MNLRFILGLAWRDSRGSRGRLALFALCVGCGVAAMVCTDSVTANLRARLRTEARTLLAGDVEITARTAFSESFRKLIQIEVDQGASMAESAELLSMVATADGATTRLTEVKAVSDNYPLYGSLKAAPPSAIPAFREGKGVLAASGLLTQMGIQRGTTLKIGELSIPIAGTLEVEPDRVGEAFRLGHRILLRFLDLPRTQLVGPMSRVSYRMLLRLPEGRSAEAVRDRLKRQSSDRWLEYRVAGEGSQGVERFLARAETFLNLVGLAALLLAGIGVAIAIRTFLAQRLDSLAILKCIGVTSYQIVSIYLTQVVLLATLGSLAGATAGTLLQRALPGLLAGVVPFAVDPTAVTGVILRDILIGTALSTAFAVIPILALRKVAPLAIFTRAVGGSSRTRDPLTLVAMVVLTLGCCALALDRAGSPETAGWFLLGFVVAVVSLYLATWLFLKVIRFLHPFGPFWLRHGVANLHRPGNQTGSVMVAIGLGVFLVQLVYLVETVLASEFTVGLSGRAPNIFLIDVQEDQLERVREIFSKAGESPDEIAPLVRSHIAAIDGKPIRALYPDLEKAPWWVNREYVLTYRNHLAPAEAVLRGTFWGKTPTAQAEVSVERATAERFGVDLGSSLTLDCQGQEVTAKVTSIRKVRWSSMRPNFFLVLTPKLLAEMPHTYFLVSHVPSAETRLNVQRQLVAAFPNLTVIDLSAGIAVLHALVDRLAMVIALAAFLCIAGGIVVLSASISMTRRHRTYESAILKAQGMTTPELLRMLGVEYLLLGLVGGTVGAIAAMGAAQQLAQRLFEVSLSSRPIATLVAGCAAATLTVVTGAIASRGILDRAPLEILRDE